MARIGVDDGGGCVGFFGRRIHTFTFESTTGGVVLLGMGAWFAGYYSIISFWRQRSTQAGTNALVAIVAMLVILGLVNFLAVRYSARFDLTETNSLPWPPSQRN